MMKIIEKAAAMGGLINRYTDKTLREEMLYGYVLEDALTIEKTDTVDLAALSWDKAKRKFVIKVNESNIITTFKEFHNDDEEKLVAIFRMLLKHEIQHYILLHWMNETKDPIEQLLWNIAEDAAINADLDEFDKLGIPTITAKEWAEAIIHGKDVVAYGIRGSGWDDAVSAEQIYHKLKEMFKGHEEKLAVAAAAMKFGMAGHDVETGVNANEDEVNEILEKIKEIAEKTAGTAAGDAALKVVLKRLNRPLTLPRMLKKLTSNRAMTKKTSWKRFSRRYDMPPGSKYSYEAATALVMIDVSGSVEEEEITTALSKVRALLRADDIEMDVVTYDVGVRDVLKEIDIRRGRVTITGRGGTSLKDTVEDIKKRFRKRWSIVIVITDGYDEWDPAIKDIAARVGVILTKDHNKDFAEAAKDDGAYVALLE